MWIANQKPPANSGGLALLILWRWKEPPSAGYDSNARFTARAVDVDGLPSFTILPVTGKVTATPTDHRDSCWIPRRRSANFDSSLGDF